MKYMCILRMNTPLVGYVKNLIEVVNYPEADPVTGIVYKS
jgi:hypothetical protein